MKTIISKIIVFLLAIIMTFPVFAPLASAKASSSKDAAQTAENVLENGRKPTKQAQSSKNKNSTKIGKFRKYLKSKKPITTFSSNMLDGIYNSVPALVDLGRRVIFV